MYIFLDKELLPYLPGLTEKLFLLLMGDFVSGWGRG